METNKLSTELRALPPSFAMCDEPEASTVILAAADRIESDAAEHDKFVADVLHLRGEIEWLGVENDKLTARVRELEAALVEKDELIRLLGCWYETECSSDTPHLGVRREMRDGGTRRVWILRNYWSEEDVCEMGDGELPKMNDEARKVLARG